MVQTSYWFSTYPFRNGSTHNGKPNFFAALVRHLPLMAAVLSISPSSCSRFRRGFNPLLCSRQRRVSALLSGNRIRAYRLFVTSATKFDVFTSPEIVKSFDFSNEERIYKWYG
ncbi:unnamed protein product [Cuscuta campestris]|uniref:Uncharacterized protein n=1 Tax=Cuscuta campestris TaxID=132261 RepID=A0A484LHH8_9ASTE|nr:unnamed protein product [Cuscuta campestris]